MDKQKRLFYQIGRLLFILVSIVVIYITIKYMLILFYPFALATLLSFVLNPLVSYFVDKTKMSRFFITSGVLLIVLMIIISLIIFVIAEFIQGTLYLAEKVPSHYQLFLKFVESFLNEKIVPIYQKLVSIIQTLDDKHQYTINENIENLISYLAATGANFLQDFLLKIPHLISIIPYSFTIIIFILIATFLITNDWHQLKKFARGIIPESINKIGGKLIKQLEKSFLGYLKAQCMFVSLSAVILFIGLIILKIEQALTISLIISIIDLIPLIGIGIVFIPWIIYLFFMQDYSLTIGLSIVYMVIIITRQILEPKILSTNIGINPLASLLTLYIGFQFWGITGVIIAPILLVFASAIHQAGITKLLFDYIKG